MIEKMVFHHPAGQSLHYLQYIPREAGEHPERKYPLVFFLHGYGECGPEDGSALDRVAVHGYPKHILQGREYPFILVAPQCPLGRYWGCFVEPLDRLLRDRLAALPVDPDRVILTGLSMGGTGTWLWGMGYPERFAAIAPVCGTGVTWYGEALKNVPVWAFHGDCDDVVPPAESLNMVSAVNRHGGHAKLTLYHGTGHNAWDFAYDDPAFLEWILAQRRSGRE